VNNLQRSKPAASSVQKFGELPKQWKAGQHISHNCVQQWKITEGE